MAIWRIIIRSSYLKHASNQLTRNYSKASLATSLTHVVKKTKLSSFHSPNPNICTRTPSNNIFQNLRFLATSAQTRKKEENVDSDGPRLNEKITAEYVRLVSEEGHSVVSLREALRRAKELESDLVEVQREAKPPVCKIVKYTLEKYKKAKEGKERAKAKRAEAIRPEVKEIRFTPKIEAKDLKFKADQALKLMESGYRVKCNAVPDKDKHKELEPEKLLELLFRITCHIGDALVEFGPEADRKSAVVILRHAKFGPPKKGGVKKMKDMDIKSARVKVSSETGVSTVDDQGDIEKSEPGLSAEQAQPVEHENTYAKREPIGEFSGGTDGSRFEPRSPNQPANPQRPRFQNQVPNQQPTGRFDPQSPNQPPNAPRPQFPNQQPTGRFDPQSPNQPPNAPRPQFPNQQPTGRFDPQSPNQPPNAPRPQFPNQQPTGRFDPRFPNQPPSPPRPRFPDQAPNQQPSGPSPNRHLDRQVPPPPFQNQAPNQQPTNRFETPPPNPPRAPPPNPPRAPPRPQTRLPNETPNQQPTGPGRSSGPASSYGIFSTPKSK
ncbi:Translation initiation factor IF3-1 [Cardamine amara subsp. amara]|uniref:Translation initiation factor IF3-1 n=1 Tax=Cardamine amara subsp. amara TaxID=228776 RepID=A0ABD1BQF1_CARAN